MNLTVDCWKRGSGGTQREEDRKRGPGTKVASRERLARETWGDKGGPGHHAVCGLGPGLFAFNMKRIGPFKVGGDPSEETRLTPEIMGAS